MRTLNPRAVSRLRRDIVNAALTIARARRLALAGKLCHGAAMLKPDPRAGGCFFAALILGGFVAGLALGNPMAGILSGFAAGATVALLVWIADRTRRR